MAKLTIRTRTEDDANIAEVSKLLGRKSINQSVLIVLEEYPKLRVIIDEQEREIVALKAKMYKVERESDNMIALLNDIDTNKKLLTKLYKRLWR